MCVLGEKKKTSKNSILKGKKRMAGKLCSTSYLKKVCILFRNPSSTSQEKSNKEKGERHLNMTL
jgi:hypothetical protein